MPRSYEGLLPIRSERREVAEATVIEEAVPVVRRLALAPPRAGPSVVSATHNRAIPRVARRLWGFGAVFGAVLSAVMVWSPLVSALPDMNPLPVEVGLLEFRNIRSETVALGGVRTLFIEGEIVNRSANAIDLPAIEIALKSGAGQTVTSWLVRLASEGLAAGRSIGFRSALASPPPDATQVTLHLSQRGPEFGLQ